jgi:hypothetical protein
LYLSSPSPTPDDSDDPLQQLDDLVRLLDSHPIPHIGAHEDSSDQEDEDPFADER